MLSLKNLSGAKEAAAYYQKVLDYYAGGEHPVAIDWQGKALEALYNKTPSLEDFVQLLEGKLPNGQNLGRFEDGKLNHRPGIDLTFSAPKSASILALVYGDKDVIKAHSYAVTQTLKLLENTILQTRVNGEPAPADKVIFAKFLEMLSRELDPQIHTHCVLLNLSQSMSDGKFRSLHYDAVYDASMLAGVTYRSFLAIEMQKLGYEIEVTSDKGTFEIKGVPKQLIDLFSKRREQILEAALHNGRFDAKHLDKLNLITRKNKVQDAPLSEQIEKWKIEANELCHHLSVNLEKGHSQFKNGKGFRLRDTQKIANEAIQAGIAKLDEFKRMMTKTEVIYEATRLSLGQLIPKAIDEAWQRALDARILHPIRNQAEESTTNSRQQYYMSANNVTLANKLKQHAQQHLIRQLGKSLLGFVAGQWIITKNLNSISDHAVYQKLIDFTLNSNKREMIIDNLNPKTDKEFLTRASQFSSVLGVHLFNVTVSSIDRKICEQAGIKTWSLNYLNQATIKQGSIIIIHGSEKLLYSQMQSIQTIAKNKNCLIVWANDKNTSALDRRLSPIELIASHLPRASFSERCNTESLQLKNLSSDNFIEKFANIYTPNVNTLLLSYQKDTINLLVRRQLIQQEKLAANGITVSSYIHQYSSQTELSRPTTYQVGDILRLNNLSLIDSHNKIRMNDHFKISDINDSTLTLVHSKHYTKHQLNIEKITQPRDLTLFREQPLAITIGERLLLPSMNIYGARFQNQIGEVVSFDSKAITLKLAHEDKPFVLHLQDKNGYERSIYADYGYCAHPSARIENIQQVHLDCRAMHSINALRALAGMEDKNVTLYTDYPKSVARALESIQTNLSIPIVSIQTQTSSMPNALESNINLKTKLSITALSQAVHELSGDGKTQFSQWEITQHALALEIGQVDIHDMLHGFQSLLNSGDITKKGQHYTASWVIQSQQALTTAFHQLENESSNLSKQNNIPYDIPKLSQIRVLDYLKQQASKLEAEPKQAILNITITNNGLSLLQGPAGSAKTSLVLRHVAALFQAEQYQVIGIAPQHSQKDELCKKAGIPTMTLKKFLQNEKNHQLQDLMDRGKTVVLVDESSMLSYKEMLNLTHIASKYSIKMVFAGDSAQLDSPRSAQPFLYLQQQEKIEVSTLRKIYRQCAIKHPVLHKAIVDLVKLKTGEQAKSLVPYLRHPELNKNLIDTLCNTYHKLPQFLKDDSLILTLTNAERSTVNELLRIQNKPTFGQVMLQREDLSTELRYRAAYYTQGHILKFNKEIKPAGITVNSYWEIIDINIDKNTLTLAACHLNDKGELARKHIITIDPMRKIFHSDNTLEYYAVKTAHFSVDEKIMLTQNVRHSLKIALNTSKQGILKSFNNTHFTVDFGHNQTVKFERNHLPHAVIDYGYARTYHNAQSLDAACVLMLADIDNKHMLNYESNYVGATRTKKFLRIFTQDKENYLRQTSKSYRGLSIAKPRQSKQEVKVEINEAKLLDHLSYKIERNAEKLLGNPKKILQRGLLYGDTNIAKGLLVITKTENEINRGDCLYSNKKLDFIKLIEIVNNKTREESLHFAAEILLGQPIEDYYLGKDKRSPLTEKFINKQSDRISQANLDAMYKREQGIQKAQRLYQLSRPAKNTLAETYLVKHRHIPKEIIHQHSNDIRFIYYNHHPAALFPLHDKDGNIQAVHLVYLDAKTAQKTNATIGCGTNTFALAKQTFGPMKGASIQLGDPSGIPHLAEGPETGLSILAINPKARVHITCSLTNIPFAPIKDLPNKIVLCADNDMIGDKAEQAKKNLLTAIEKLTQNHFTHVHVILPKILNEQKTDFNDLLSKKGLEVTRSLFEQAVDKNMIFEIRDFNENNQAQQKLERLINTGKQINNEYFR
ncbi:MAG: MobF family relaxase [Legionellales bacterium]|jgi:conjugative relaxase-like TrwC/TraI family protein